MIVRISGEGQFDLADSESARLNELEEVAIAAANQGKEEEFRSALTALLDHVRAAGKPVPDDELEGSDVILPPADTSLAEAAAEFTGEGLIPD
jgi:hypothetical protein